MATWLDEKKHEILITLHYKPLYNINPIENVVKDIQTAVYNGARTVHMFTESKRTRYLHIIVPIQAEKPFQRLTNNSGTSLKFHHG